VSDALCRLYLITPPAVADLEAFAPRLEAALDAGDVAALQIRLKEASDAAVAAAVRALAPLAQNRGVAVILNDRPDLARDLDCDGVHVGQGDAPYEEARRIVGAQATVGVTCHDSRHLAMQAAEAGADYVAFGAFFPTAKKPGAPTPELEILEAWQEAMTTPCVAIGGITADNARTIAAAGADFIAVCQGVWAHPDGPAAAVAALQREIAAGAAARS
jgi:thiamine-phosphate pyrophosphorylase